MKQTVKPTLPGENEGQRVQSPARNQQFGAVPEEYFHDALIRSARQGEGTRPSSGGIVQRRRSLARPDVHVGCLDEFFHDGRVLAEQGRKVQDREVPGRKAVVDGVPVRNALADPRRIGGLPELLGSSRLRTATGRPAVRPRAQSALQSSYR